MHVGDAQKRTVIWCVVGGGSQTMTHCDFEVQNGGIENEIRLNYT